jgi:2-oxoglutarate dehydrogenase E2 component (dihydrolipoamide succinyltransferase)
MSLAEIKVPSVGESITEVVVSEWLKPEGAWVEKDEPLVTLETDKVNVDVAAPQAGVLTSILKSKEAVAKVGEVIGKIDSAAQRGVSKSQTDDVPQAPATPAQTRVMPAAERLLVQNNLQASDVTATGPGGRVLKEDVQQNLNASKAPAATPKVETRAPAEPANIQGEVGREKESVRMTPLRKRVAERLLQAQSTAALLTTFNEVDMSRVMDLRNRFKDAFLKKYNTKLGFMSFFVKATIEALKAYPELNAQIDGDNIIYHNYYDIGVAVDSDKGLVVPVLKNAELLSFAETEQGIIDYGKRARENKLKIEELQGGTFTISNGGVFGSMMSTPIVNPPQSGILGMHAINERPVGVNGQIVLRPMMYIALTYDHRIVDGRGAVSFLKRIKECIESPERMLLEI